MTDARAWVPLLRKLREHGWEHQEIGGFGAADHVWTRNRSALNEQRITWNLSGAMLSINGRSMTGRDLCPAECRVVLRMLGAFRPAPPRVDRDDPFTRQVRRAARLALLTMAAKDPELADDTFIVLKHAIEGRPL